MPVLALLGFLLIFPVHPINGLDLLFAGDLMVHEQNYTYRPFSDMYREVAPLILPADLSFVNLEFPVRPERPYGGYPYFNAHREYVEAALGAGFDVFSLANNHSADQGKEGVRATLRETTALAGAGGKTPAFNGLRIHGDPADKTPLPEWTMQVLEARGYRIGFVSVTEFVNVPSLGAHVQMLAWRDSVVLDRFAAWIREQRSHVDFLVLGIHWGVEYALATQSVQKAAAARMVEAGVDILWGHHPHVLQPWYSLESPRGSALVLPSMGNFVSAQAWYLEKWMGDDNRSWRGDSALFMASIDRDGEGRVTIHDIQPVLIAHRRMPGNEIRIFPYRELLKDEDPDWRSYFTKRFDHLTGAFAGSREASLFWDEKNLVRLRNLPEDPAYYSPEVRDASGDDTSQ